MVILLLENKLFSSLQVSWIERQNKGMPIIKFHVKADAYDGQRPEGLESLNRGSASSGLKPRSNADSCVFTGCSPEDASPSFEELQTIGALTIVCIGLYLDFLMDKKKIKMLFIQSSNNMYHCSFSQETHSTYTYTCARERHWEKLNFKTYSRIGITQKNLVLFVLVIIHRTMKYYYDMVFEAI